MAEDNNINGQNSPDELEQQIREKLHVGQEFNSWVELSHLLGFDNFGGGKQGKLAQKKILKYIAVEYITRRKFRISEIYEKPHVSIDHRGQTGRYATLIKPTLLFSMRSDGQNHVYYTYEEIAEKCGIVNRNFLNYHRLYEAIRKKNLKLTVRRIDDFVIVSRGVFKPSINTALKQLSEEHILVSRKMFCFSKDGGKTYYVCDVYEADCLIEAESEIRREVPYEQWQIVFDDRIRQEFYRLVRERFQEKTGNVLGRYYPVIEIEIIDEKKADTVACKDQQEYFQFRNTLNGRIKSRLLTRTENEFLKNCMTEKARVEEYEETVKKLMLIGDANWRRKYELLPKEERAYLMDETSIQMTEELVSMLIDLDSDILF